MRACGFRFQTLTATSEASVHLTSQVSSDKDSKSAKLSECVAAMPAYQAICAKGYGTGLVEAGDPTRGYENAVAICAADKDFKSACLDGVAQAAHDWAPSARQKEVCVVIRQVDASAGDSCNTIMNSSGTKKG